MKAKEVAMIVAISVLAALFIGLLVDAVYEAPEYDEYCDEVELRMPKPLTQDDLCPGLSRDDEDKVESCYATKGQPMYEHDADGCQTSFKECNMCSKEYRDAQDLYNRNIFFIIAPIAVLFIIAGVYWVTEVIGTGFMFSGIWLLIYATMRYFSGMSKILRVIVIGIELFLLLLISWKKLKK